MNHEEQRRMAVLAGITEEREDRAPVSRESREIVESMVEVFQQGQADFIAADELKLRKGVLAEAKAVQEAVQEFSLAAAGGKDVSKMAAALFDRIGALTKKGAYLGGVRNRRLADGRA